MNGFFLVLGAMSGNIFLLFLAVLGLFLTIADL